MAKTIKFNLLMDGHSVRTIEDVQEHFSIEDMLNYYENGLLVRWLEVRGYSKEVERVQAIDTNLDDLGVIKELILIFEVETKIEEIEKAIGILAYLKDEKICNEEYAKTKFKKDQIIDDYHSGYDALLAHIRENANDMPAIKADITELERSYFGLFVLDNYRLFYDLVQNAPKAIYVILTRDRLREYWIGESANNQIATYITGNLNCREILGNDLKIVKRNTQAMWDPIEKPDVLLMVLQITSGTFVKNAGEFSEKIDYTEINGKFRKFKGLEYQCNNESYDLLYMEV